MQITPLGQAAAAIGLHERTPSGEQLLSVRLVSVPGFYSSEMRSTARVV